jgi:hypothetical protein
LEVLTRAERVVLADRSLSIQVFGDTSVVGYQTDEVSATMRGSLNVVAAIGNGGVRESIAHVFMSVKPHRIFALKK